MRMKTRMTLPLSSPRTLSPWQLLKHLTPSPRPEQTWPDRTCPVTAKDVRA